MLLYSRIPRFSPRTGKPVDPELVEDRSRFVCDYSGELINADDDALKPLYYLAIDYNHDSEPLWDQDAHKFEKEFKIGYGDFGKFMSSAFHFTHTETYGSADLSWFLIDEWVAARRGKDKKHRFFECATIEQLLSTLRQDTLRKILRGKKFTLEQLGFTHPSDET